MRRPRHAKVAKSKASKSKASKAKSSKSKPPTKPKRATPKRPEQDAMFPEAEATIKAIEVAARATVDAQDQRMAWGQKEKEARATLQHELSEHGFTPSKGYKRGPVEAWLDVEEVKAKARVKNTDNAGA